MTDRLLPLRPVVAAAIVDAQVNPSRLLCTARAYPTQLRGLFELPGGKVEPGEDPESALLREIQEELGATISLGAELLPPPGIGVQTSPNQWQWPILEGRTMRVWWATILPGQVAEVGDSHLEARWVPWEDVLDLPWLPTNRPIVTQLLAERVGKATFK
ncbi:NUDIX domain-containing protein [Actinomyces sp. F1_1611]